MKTEILKPTRENIVKCANLIKRGEIVAFPTETVYGLGANGLNAEAVKKIFEAKGRPQTNPLTLHVCSYEQIRRAAYVSPDATVLIERFMPGPLTIVLRKKDSVPSATVAGGTTVAVRMPANDIALSLIKECGLPIAAPSANSSARPSPTAADHVKDDLDGKVGFILDGGRCELGIESTIVDLSGKEPSVLRKGAIAVSDIEEALGKTLSDRSCFDGRKIPAGYVPKINLIYVPFGCKDDVFCAEFIKASETGRTEVTGISKPGFVSDDEFMPAGKNAGDYAKHVFEIIRDAENNGVMTLFCIGTDGSGVGDTVNSRLEKLSGGRRIGDETQ